MGAATTSVVVDDLTVEELEVILGHPHLAGGVSLYKAMGMTHWRSTRHRRCFAGSTETSMMSVGASCYGLPCSRSRQPMRRQGQMRGSISSRRNCSKGRGLPSMSLTLSHRRCWSMPQSYMPQPRPRPMPPSSRRRTSLCAYMPWTNRSEWWKSWSRS
jgi:hypothetical protein